MHLLNMVLIGVSSEVGVTGLVWKFARGDGLGVKISHFPSTMWGR